MIMTDGQSGSGGVLRLRNLTTDENIRRAENPLRAMQDHADALRKSCNRRLWSAAVATAATSMLADSDPDTLSV